MKNVNPFLLLGGGTAAIFVAALVGVMIWVAADKPRSTPFHASFSLVDDGGNLVDQSLFTGKPSLVYFGYTHCPEVCPTTLFEVADWLNALGPDGQKVKAYFFTVDPARDTRQVMHSYVSAITDRITGVTGSEAEMQKVIKGWRIFAEKLPSSDGDYHMSHTTSLLMIGADGRLKGLIPYGSDREEALAKIRAVLLTKSS